MTITLPADQDSIITRLVAKGRFASPQEAIADALRRLEAEENFDYLNPQPLTAEEAAAVYIRPRAMRFKLKAGRCNSSPPPNHSSLRRCAKR